MKYQIYFLLLSLIFQSCYRPHSQAYRELYSYLDTPIPQRPMHETDYFLVILVEARHLDYTDNYSFLKTVAKHPSDGSKNRDVGHAWVYVQGLQNGIPIYLEGGHSGELGVVQAKYFDGIMNYLDFGYANPTYQQCLCPRYEPNPVKYLWETQRDGFFQWGAGRHRPTFAAKIDLTPDQFQRILKFIHCYRYCDYAITGNQCSSFVAQIASLAGLDLDCEVTMSIEPVIYFNGREICLWSDPMYQWLTISSPDILERSLMEAVREGRVENALGWCK